MAKTTTRTAMKASTRTTTKPKGRKAAPAAAPAEASRDNRYLRAARIIIADGEGIDLGQLAAKGGMSTSTAGHCREAWKGVSQALREAGLLHGKAPDDAPVAASAPDEPKAAEPEVEAAAA
jgi:hypothetical protein